MDSKKAFLTARTRLAASPILACVLAAALSFATMPASAQGFGDMLKKTVKRAVTGEVQRKADEEARRATRCALGDEACVRAARERGEQVETPDGGSSGGADHPLVPRYPGAQVVRHETDNLTDYGLRIGKAKRAGTLTVEGRLTRITYQGPPDRSVLELIRHYESQLRRDGFEILYSCSRAECGDIPQDIESEQRYILLWGAGDHRYRAAKLVRPEGDVHVAVYVTRNDSGGPARGRAMVQLDVIESQSL